MLFRSHLFFVKRLRAIFDSTDNIPDNDCMITIYLQQVILYSFHYDESGFRYNPVRCMAPARHSV